MDDRMADSEMMGDIQADAFEQGQKSRENDLTSMFADIDMKLKAIAETLQGQIEEIRQRVEVLEKK